MFRSLSKDNSEYNVIIQGAKSRSTSNNIASIVFQNFDNDSKQVYNMASMAVRDHYGSDVDGLGDLLFLTSTVSNNLVERLRITNDGNVGIGTETPEYKLHVDGDMRVSSNIIADVVNARGFRVYEEGTLLMNNPFTSFRTIDGFANVPIFEQELEQPAQHTTFYNSVWTLVTSSATTFETMMMFTRRNNKPIKEIEIAAYSTSTYDVRLFNITKQTAVKLGTFENTERGTFKVTINENDAVDYMNDVMEIQCRSRNKNQKIVIEEVTIFYL